MASEISDAATTRRGVSASNLSRTLVRLGAATAADTGLLPADIPPLDTLMTISQLGAAWGATPEIHGQVDAADPAVIEQRRTAAGTIATRLFPPAP